MQDRPQLGGEIVQQASTKLQKLASHRSLWSRLGKAYRAATIGSGPGRG